MDTKIKNRLMRTGPFCLLALLIGAGVGWVQIQMQYARVSAKPGKDVAIPMAGVQIGGPYTLSDHTGQKVTEQTYAGRYKLIYFGFTYCPAICPTALQKIAQVMKALEKDHPDSAARLQPLFISVDPERDTVEAMKNYVGLFHPRLVGLTGTIPQVDIIKKAYRVFAAKVETEAQTEYTVDHSTFIYLMGPDDSLLSMFRMTDTADQIYAEVEKHLAAPAEAPKK